MKSHKWTKEIKAWADGAEIQFKDSHDRNEWFDCTDNEPTWETVDFLEYRIKPQPKEPQYLYVYFGVPYTAGYQYFVSKVAPFMMKEFEYIGKIKLEDE